MARRKKTSLALVPTAPEDPAIALADAIMRLDDALDAVQARMSELSEAHRAKQAAKEAARRATTERMAADRVAVERVKPSTKAVKAGTGTLRLSGGAKPAAAERQRPRTQPIAKATSPAVVHGPVPEVSIDEAADRLMKTLESQAERLEGAAEAHEA